jgi:hypothetical protein
MTLSSRDDHLRVKLKTQPVRRRRLVLPVAVRLQLPGLIALALELLPGLLQRGSAPCGGLQLLGQLIAARVAELLALLAIDALSLGRISPTSCL